MASICNDGFVDPRRILYLEQTVEAKSIFSEGMAAARFIVWRAIFDVWRVKLDCTHLITVSFHQQKNLALCCDDEIFVHEAVVSAQPNFAYNRRLSKH